MALNSGPLPVANPPDIAKDDFNTAMTQLNNAFPLQPVDMAPIPPTKLDAIAPPTDGYVFSYDEATGKGEWIAPGGGAPVGLFVPRRVTAFDFTQTDFILDSNIHENGLDLSLIVPVGAIAVQLTIYDSTFNNAGESCHFMTNQTDAPWNRFHTKMFNAGQGVSNQGVIPIDPDRLLDYVFYTTSASFLMYVSGWYI